MHIISKLICLNYYIETPQQSSRGKQYCLYKSLIKNLKGQWWIIKQ